MRSLFLTCFFAVLLASHFVLFQREARASPTPPLLQKIIQSTLEKNEIPLLKKEELIQAEEQKNQATGALLPTFQFLGTALVQDTPESSSLLSTYPRTQTTARLNLKQNLFRGGSEYALYRKTGLFVEQKKNELLASQQKVIVDLIQKFLVIYQSEKESNRLQNEISLYDQQIKELKKRVAIGRSRQSDYLNVEATRATTVARKIAEDINRKNNIQELEILSGLKLESASFKEALFSFDPLKPLAAYESSVLKNTDIISAQSKVKTIEEDMSTMRGQHYPQLDVSGNYWLRRASTLNHQIDWDLSLNLTLPIYSGGVIESQVREAASRYKSAQIDESRISREILTQIRSLHFKLSEGEAQISALKNGVDLTRQTKERMQNDYRLSLVTILDVITSTKNFSDAERAYDELKSSLILSRLLLDTYSQTINLTESP